MLKKVIPLSKPNLAAIDIFRALLVLKGNQLVQSKNVERLERSICKFTGAKYSVVMNNGTAPLLVSLMKLGIGPGDEVIVPAFSFIATANVVEFLGAKPIFLDITEDCCINLTLINECITSRTKAVIVVYEFGVLVDLRELRTNLERQGVALIEDAACALGSEFIQFNHWENSVFATFSFHPRKIITSGEGGALITNQEDVYLFAKSIRNHGQKSDSKTNADGTRPYVLPGLNLRMTEFQAALLYGQLKRLPKLVKKRNRLAEVYNNELAGTNFIPIASNGRFKHNYQTFFICPKVKLDLVKLMEYMETNGVKIGVGAQFIPAEPYYSEKYQVIHDTFPITRYFRENGFALPMYEKLRTKQVRSVARLLKKFSGDLNDS
jgi:perosamine synthetase